VFLFCFYVSDAPRLGIEDGLEVSSTRVEKAIAEVAGDWKVEEWRQAPGSLLNQ